MTEKKILFRHERRKLWTKKSRWVQQIRIAERDIRNMLRLAKTQSNRPTVSHFVSLGNRIIRLGTKGEKLWELLYSQKARPEMLGDVTDQLCWLEELSTALGKAAKALVGFEVKSFRPYINTKTQRFISFENELLNELEEFQTTKKR